METDTGVTSDHPPADVPSNPLLGQPEDEQERLKRFQIELEFVQCLANPWYLHNLAQQRYFDDPAFLNYIDYLQYFRKPEYAKFIIYPHCLHFLTLLQYPSFREALLKQETGAFVHEKQYYHWQYLRNQDKVVRKEIGPDGVPVEIKSEDDFQQQQVKAAAQQQPEQAPSVPSPAQGQPSVAGAAGVGKGGEQAPLNNPQPVVPRDANGSL